MEKTEQFEARRKEMSDAELIEKCKSAISAMCEKGERGFRMSIPPRVDDTDLLLSELILRYASAISAPSSIGEEEIIKQAELFAGSNYIKNHFPDQHGNRLSGFMIGAKWAISRLSAAKEIKLPNESEAYADKSWDGHTNAYSYGWNAAIEAVKQLNSLPTGQNKEG